MNGSGGSAIALRGATVRFGDHVIWEKLDLDVAPGRCLAILGPNGAGKSTLLKVLLGLLPLSAGTITIDGRPPGHGSAEAGYVAQQRVFDPDLPIRGRDLVQFGVDGQRPGLPRTRARQVDPVIEAVGAQSYADVPIGLLSGGQQQRLRIAQALAGAPRLLLCDEPLLSLDPAAQEEIVAVIDRHRREHGTTVVYVTHEITPIADVVDQVLYVAAGRWAAGSPDTVLTTQSLSALYGTHIDVIRVHGHIVIVGGDGAGACTHPTMMARRPGPRSARRAPRPLAGRTPALMGLGFLLQQPFAQHALLAAALVAVSCGLIGPFVVTRGMAFAVHGTAELAFTGAAAGLLDREQPCRRGPDRLRRRRRAHRPFGARQRERDSAIGVILAFGMGIGVLLLGFYQGFASAATNILFGNIFGVSGDQLIVLLVIGLIVVAVMGIWYRPLLFASVDPEAAEARGVPVRGLGLLFLVVLALTVTGAAQVVGTLLVLSLAITPAAAAQRLSASPLVVAGLSIVFAVVAADGGLLASFQSNVKASVFITSFSFAIYVVARLIGPLLRDRRRAHHQDRPTG